MNKEEITTLVKELKNGSNWLSATHGVFSYSKAPKQAHQLLEILSETTIPDIIKELRASTEWRIEGYGSWKDCTTRKSNAPAVAADTLEKLYEEITGNNNI